MSTDNWGEKNPIDTTCFFVPKIKTYGTREDKITKKVSKYK